MSVSPDELTGTEQAVLLVLMAEDRPVPNPELKTLGPDLKKSYRDRLKDKRLIDVIPGRPMQLVLDDRGWDLCRKLIGTEPPAGTVGQNKALYTVMKALRRYLDREGLAHNVVFSRVDDPAESSASAERTVAAAEDGDVEQRVRGAYAKLANGPGTRVGLARLRAELADIPRREIDAALLALDRQRGVDITPQEDQKLLTNEDRAAAIRIGIKDSHMIVIES